MATKRKADDDLLEFEEQLKQEEAERQLARSVVNNEGGQENVVALGNGSLRRDPDGTLYEFDATRKAWFPKVKVV